MRKITVLLMTALLGTMAVQAQKKTVDKVVSINFRDINAIKKGDEITGYYMFYKADKLKGKDYTYRLRILDQAGEKVAEKSITASKYFTLLEASYNEELLCFKFYDAKEKKISLQFYNENAEKVSTKSYEISKYEKQMINLAMTQKTDVDPSLHNINKKGFLHYKMVKNSNMGYEITYYPNVKGEKSWKYGSKSNSPVVEFASLLEASEELILNLLIIKKNRMTRDAEYYLSGLDPNTGKEIFRTKLENDKYEESLMNSYYDVANKTINLFGYYFPRGEDPIGGKSLGLSMTTMGLDGKIIKKDYISWAEDVSKLLPSNAKGKLDDIGFIYFHEFVKKPDGTMYGIGESYKKNISGLGVASKVLSMAQGSTGSGSIFQVKIEDFYFFEFDKDFKVKAIKVFEKSPVRVEMPAGAAYYGPQFLAYYVEALGFFSFDYIKVLDGGNTFSVLYRNYERIKGEKNKTICGAISHTGNEYAVDKIEIPTEANSVKILPAQDGNILFVEYYKGEKAIKLNFQKINY